MWMKLRQLPLRWKLSGLGLIGLLILGYVIYAYLTSPLWVVHRTFAALDRRDVHALVSLTSEKERRLLNLTPQTVAACLRETWWRDRAFKPVVRVKGRRAQYADILLYRVEVSGFTRNGRPQTAETEIDIYQDISGRWRLALSELLYLLFPISNGKEGDYAPEWDALARRAEIKGTTFADGATRYADGTFSPRIYLTRR